MSFFSSVRISFFAILNRDITAESTTAIFVSAKSFHSPHFVSFHFTFFSLSVISVVHLTFFHHPLSRSLVSSSGIRMLGLSWHPRNSHGNFSPLASFCLRGKLRFWTCSTIFQVSVTDTAISKSITRSTNLWRASTSIRATTCKPYQP